MTAQDAARERGDGPAYTLRRLREIADLSEAPPLVPLDVRLVEEVEEVVHGEDVRRALGLQHDYPVEAVVPALEHQVRTKVSIGGGRERVAGVRLEATDWPPTGHRLAGPGLPLLG